MVSQLLVDIGEKELKKKRTDEGDDADLVEVVEEIVGRTVRGHGSTHRTLGSVETSIRHVEDGKEEEELASLDGSLHLLNEGVVPGDLGRKRAGLGLNPGGKGGVPVTLESGNLDDSGEGRKWGDQGRAHESKAAESTHRPASRTTDPWGGTLTTRLLRNIKTRGMIM